MKQTSRNVGCRNPLASAWLAVGGLLAVGFAVMVVRELPSMRREIHLMRM
ncbi:MAG TPA: hypothetical protein VFM25_00360 [Verrucomicrobiae bacterium]|nr:hypothetical protein [Verrucomicrobiae bacterium]